MKPKATLRNFLAIAGSSLLAMSSTHAQTTYYWDGNNDTTGFGTAGGTWAAPTTGTLTSGWTTAINGDADIVGNSITTTTLDSLNFGRVSVGNSLATGTITVSGTVNSGNMTFGAIPSGPVTTLTGGTINFADSVNISMGNAFAIIESQVSGAATSISKAGSTSTLRFSNTNNSYTGLTSIIGTLEVMSLADGGSNSSIGASSNAASNLVISGGNGGGTLSYIGSDNVSTNRLFALNNSATGTIASNGVGTLNFTNTGAIAYGGTAGQARTLGLSGTNAGLNILNPSIADNGAGVVSVTKSGTGTWMLGNTSNSYTGATTVQQGTLVINSINDAGLASAIGAGTLILGSGNNTGTLAYTGAAAESNRTVQVNSSTNTNNGGAAILNYGTGALTFDAATFNVAYGATGSVTRTLTLGGTNGGTISGKIVNNSANSLVGIAKAGSGTWTLQGNNENTGASSISGGGNLVLDYTSNTGSKLSETASLTLSGGTITLKGGSSLTEVVGSTAVSGGATFITRDGGNTVLQLNALTQSSGGSISFVDGTVATTTTLNGPAGILGGWATIGSNFAANDGTGKIVAYSGPTTALPSSGGGGGTTNYTLTGDQVQTGSSDLSVATLKITGLGVTDNTLALGSTNLNVVNNGNDREGGILYTGGGTGVYNITADAGKGITVSNTARDLTINTVAGTLQIDATLAASQTNTNLLKAGAGTLVLSAANPYTATTYVNEGVLRLASATAAGTSAGGIRVQYGAALELSNNITVDTEALDLDGSGISNGGALRNKSGSNTYGGLITTGVSGARINSDEFTSLTLTGGIATNIFQDVTFGGAGNTSVSSNAITGSGSLIKDGNGTLTISDTHSYTGATTVTGGTLIVNGNISTSILTTVGTGATLGGGGTVGSLTIDSGGFFAPGNSPGITNVNGAYIQNGTLVAEVTGLTAGIGGHDQVNVTGAVTLNGALTLAFNTFTPMNGDLIFIMLNDGTDAITGTFTGLAQGDVAATYGGFNWQISYNADSVADTFTGTLDGNDIALMAVAIPEPSVALLGALGLLALLRRRR